MLHGLARKVKARERLYFLGSHAQWAVWGAVCQNVYFCFTDYAKAFDYVDHNNLWKILQELGIPDYLMPGHSA